MPVSPGICPRCNENPKTNRGGYCKQCWADLSRIARTKRTEEQREKYRAYQRQYAQDHPEIVLASRERQRENDPDYNKKRAARQMAFANLPKPTVCKKCGSTENVENHHPDYDDPLRVEPLCARCHALEHSQEEKV